MSPFSQFAYQMQQKENLEEACKLQMKVNIENGLVVCDGRVLSEKEVIKEGQFDVIGIGKDTRLSVAKRPANLSFVLGMSPEPVFTVVFRENRLKPDQVNALVERGYFIDDAMRICFAGNQIVDYVRRAFSSPTVSVLLSLLRSMQQAGVLDSVPDNLVECLRRNESTLHNDLELFEGKLYPYQKEGVDWLTFCTSNGLGTILADDMGLGKTAQVIALICEILQREPDSRILVVVPNPLLDNWKREFGFFSPSIKPFIHYGRDRHGLAAGLAGHAVIITPYTTMLSDITLFEDLQLRLVLFDEASVLKNPASARAIASRRLLADVKIAMTGTPVENNLVDAWALSDLVFEGYLGSIESFKKRYVSPDIRQTMEADLGELEQSLRQITLRRMKTDVLDQLPPKRDIHLAVTAGHAEMEGYKAIVSAITVDMDNGGGGMLPLINRLQQYAAHPSLVDSSIGEDIDSLESSSAKFSLLMIQLEKIKASGQKVLIFATFRKAIDLIRAAIGQRFGMEVSTIDGRTPNDARQPIIDRFGATTGFDALILHPRTAGMGLNITAASNVIHYSRQWNPALEAQATARAWRNGQKESVNVLYMFYADTVEETIDERLRLKQELGARVVSVTDSKSSDKQIMIDYLESRSI